MVNGKALVGVWIHTSLVRMGFLFALAASIVQHKHRPMSHAILLVFLLLDQCIEFHDLNEMGGQNKQVAFWHYLLINRLLVKVCMGYTYLLGSLC